jgi:dihydrofolate reductase/diadenosine tetraphosphate (Ap4A) HIT family hydrolase
VIIGRKTYESIGHALPNRQNIVLSRDEEFWPGDAEVFTTLPTAIDHASSDEIFIIGGEAVYAEAMHLNLVDKIELTLVNTTVNTKHGIQVTYFPDIPFGEWEVSQEQRHHSDGFDYAYVTYIRRIAALDGMPLVYLPAARFEDQYQKMRQILNDGLCPFCPQWLDWYHDSPVLFATDHWIITPNDNPYEGTSLDLLLIPKLHVTNFNQLPVEVQADFGKAISWIIDNYNLSFGALGMRFGEMWYTGGSVAHLHAQIKVGDVDSSNFSPIRFKMSSLPE